VVTALVTSDRLDTAALEAPLAASGDVCARLVEEVQHTLPVRKPQVFADGTDEWVGSC
jgi:molybdopterin synthase catalytic subunit